VADISTAAIITAAGSGKRFGEGGGGGIPKQFAPLNGEPLLAHSIRSFSGCDSIGEIVVVVPPDWLDFVKNEIVDKFKFEKVSKLTPGGEERQHSVENGFRSLTDKPDIVLVHDGVRPFVTTETIETVITEAAESGAAICAVQATDTVKQSSPGRYIENTLQRDSIWLAQTPQGFKYEILDEAFRCAMEDGYIGTDESILVERIGVKVKLVQGSRYNIKITTKDDIILGELLLKEGII
jgi:2-C-methyl-D-erythritol 4-phosphate cytidylyltransferase